MKRWKRIAMSLMVISGVGLTALPAQNVAAINVFSQCSNNSASAVCKAQGDSLGPMIHIVINILLYMLGAVAVVMIVIGGMRYTTANGEASSVKSAKDTILYAVIGLVIAILSYSIVNFVISWF